MTPLLVHFFNDKAVYPHEIFFTPANFAYGTRAIGLRHDTKQSRPYPTGKQGQ